MIASVFSSFARKARMGALALGTFALAACDPSAITNIAPGLTGGGKVQVALLLPKGNAQTAGLSGAAENAVRLAIAGLGENAQVDLRVYDTKGEASVAATAAGTAIAEGADVILGPLFAENAVAVGNVAGPAGISVLSLSNNVDVAGGNVFVLGSTFRNSADRLVSYAFSQGKKRALIVHAKNIAGDAGQRALMGAMSGIGVNPVGVTGYEFTPEGIQAASNTIAAQAKAVGADVILLTADFGSGDLQFLAQSLPEAGLDPSVTQYAGITRWDAEPQSRQLPGIQGGWFVLPDPQRMAGFDSRYQAQFGARPHPLAAIAFDGMAAIGAVAANGKSFAPADFSGKAGFQGAGGIFRLLPSGTNQRSLAVATIRGSEVILISPAPERFRGAGF